MGASSTTPSGDTSPTPLAASPPETETESEPETAPSTAPTLTVSRRGFLASIGATAITPPHAAADTTDIERIGTGPAQVASDRGTRIDVAARAAKINGVSVSRTNRFTIVKPNAGVREGIRVGTNERAQNVLVDLTAEGANFRFNMVGANPTVRHIGFTGKSSVRDEQVSLIHVGHDSGTALIDNIYAGDGSVSSNPNDYAGCKLSFVNKNAANQVVFRRCNIGPFTDNGIYASAVGKVDDPSSKAPVTIANCYARNCGTANYRLGSDGSRLLNSVSVNNGPVPAKQGAINCRGLWAREQGTVTVENCQFYHPWDGDGQGPIIRSGGGGTPDGGHVATSNVQVTPYVEDRIVPGAGTIDWSGLADGAKNVIPTGVPTSAEKAAAGVGGSGGPIPGPSGSVSTGPSGTGPNTGPGSGPGGSPIVPIIQVGALAAILVIGLVLAIVAGAIVVIAWLERGGGGGGGSAP
jgi:hypothetical protein